MYVYIVVPLGILKCVLTLMNQLEFNCNSGVCVFGECLHGLLHACLCATVSFSVNFKGKINVQIPCRHRNNHVLTYPNMYAYIYGLASWYSLL